MSRKVKVISNVANYMSLLQRDRLAAEQQMQSPLSSPNSSSERDLIEKRRRRRSPRGSRGSKTSSASKPEKLSIQLSSGDKAPEPSSSSKALLPTAQQQSQQQHAQILSPSELNRTESASSSQHHHGHASSDEVELHPSLHLENARVVIGSAFKGTTLQQRLDRTLARKSALCILNGVLGVALMLWCFELCWTGSECVGTKHIFMIQWVTLGLSLLLVYQVMDYNRYSYSVSLYGGALATLRNSSVRGVGAGARGFHLVSVRSLFKYRGASIALQCLACLIHPVPFLFFANKASAAVSAGGGDAGGGGDALLAAAQVQPHQQLLPASAHSASVASAASSSSSSSIPFGWFGWPPVAPASLAAESDRLAAVAQSLASWLSSTELHDAFVLLMFLRAFLFTFAVRDFSSVWRNRNFIRSSRLFKPATFDWFLSLKVRTGLGLERAPLWLHVHAS
jgi:hypothetical protein